MHKWLHSARPSRYILHIKQPLSNPYLGLALEEHWFNTLKFEENANVEKKLILLWRNQPSVVVGKFQNVWKECHTGFCRAHGIHVARRSSGGGTVYHDPGNLNITIFSGYKHYNRKSNLEIVKSVLENNLNFENLEINSRDDLLWNGNKISGTAAKLNQRRAYHHFTLLFNSDKKLLKEAITSPLMRWDLKSKATKSVPSPTSNLFEIGLSEQELEEKIGLFAKGFLRDEESDFEEESVVEGNVVRKVSDAVSDGCSDSYSEDTFHEIESIEELDNSDKIIDELSGWEWIYGKTPKFVLNDKEVVKGRYEDGKKFYM